ncbi:hypothetical protein [Coleofasciculus sp. FACHB-1120]|uniref:hypothetical protein n=1 Tax=Coleofasciculus sp. FACHB-1120 TaxID=2692783 RepID=UPI001F54FA01|nr:hypothetical protein [Coleofasciculus sp. FACHB-1120]
MLLIRASPNLEQYESKFCTRANTALVNKIWSGIGIDAWLPRLPSFPSRTTFTIIQNVSGFTPYILLKSDSDNASYFL